MLLLLSETARLCGIYLVMRESDASLDLHSMTSFGGGARIAQDLLQSSLQSSAILAAVSAWREGVTRAQELRGFDPQNTS